MKPERKPTPDCPIREAPTAEQAGSPACAFLQRRFVAGITTGSLKGPVGPPEGGTMPCNGKPGREVARPGFFVINGNKRS